VVKPSRKVTLSQWTVKVHAIPNAGRAASCNTPAPELHIIFSFTLPSASGREGRDRVRVRVKVRVSVILTVRIKVRITVRVRVRVRVRFQVD
jgi:hypothetical protein